MLYSDDRLPTPREVFEVLLGVVCFGVLVFITYGKVVECTDPALSSPATKMAATYIIMLLNVTTLRVFTVNLYGKHMYTFYITYILCTLLMYYFGITGQVLFYTQRLSFLSGILYNMIC